MIRRLAAGTLPLVALSGAAAAQTTATPTAPISVSDNTQPGSTLSLPEVEVTAAPPDLIGTATTASQGVIGNQEIQLTPVYRPGQILETVPGLTVTSHSGEGKANQ
jgi:hypothetical protein